MAKKEQLFCAIIGDITRSRDLSDRSKIQRQFLRAIDKLNAEFQKDIVSNFRFKISEGDSVEGLLTGPAESYRFARRLQDLMEPVPFSIGIGVGTLSTSVSRNVDAADGDAFYRARRALELAKKTKQEIVFDFDSPALAVVNALVGLMEKEWGRLTSRQREVIRQMKEAQSQVAAARKLKISQPAVSQVLRTPTIVKMTEAEHALSEFLSLLPQTFI